MNQSNNKGELVVLGLFLAAAIFGGAYVASNSFYKVKALDSVISVTGSSQRKITSDTVKWRTSFTRTVDADGLKTGNDAMKSDLSLVLKFLKDNGVQDKDITVKPMDTNTLYQNDGNGGGYYDKWGGGQITSKIAGYTFRQEIEVNSTEIEKITKLSQESSALVGQGITFSTISLEYFYSKLSELRIEMLSEATKDAKLRAEKIAESTGAKVDSLRSASMGVFQITAPNSTDVSDYGMYDTSSIEKQITGIVRASFSLEK
jgi:hypothetical protein